MSSRRPRSLGLPTYEPAPGSVPPPGETLLEWLEQNHQTQAWLARKIGTSSKHVNRIIKGHAAYTAEMALRMATVTGISARFWMHLQADYQINQARIQLLPGEPTPAEPQPAPHHVSDASPAEPLPGSAGGSTVGDNTTAADPGGTEV